jgi:hypothetical protein
MPAMVHTKMDQVIPDNTSFNLEILTYMLKVVNRRREEHQVLIRVYEFILSATIALMIVFLLFNIVTKYKTYMVNYDIKGAFKNAKFSVNDTLYIKIIRMDSQC